jgi:hypothetical protein
MDRKRELDVTKERMDGLVEKLYVGAGRERTALAVPRSGRTRIDASSALLVQAERRGWSFAAPSTRTSSASGSVPRRRHHLRRRLTTRARTPRVRLRTNTLLLPRPLPLLLPRPLLLPHITRPLLLPHITRPLLLPRMAHMTAGPVRSRPRQPRLTQVPRTNVRTCTNRASRRKRTNWRAPSRRKRRPRPRPLPPLVGATQTSRLARSVLAARSRRRADGCGKCAYMCQA